MDIKIKCDIIEEFMRDHVLHDAFADDPDVKKFVQYNNLGIPLSQGVAYELCELTPEGEQVILSSWIAFCELFGVDPEDEYEDFDDVIITSSGELE